MISFVAAMVIARIASPQDFGLVATAGAIILVANVLSEAGLASTIIYDDEFRDDKASTILWLSTFLAVGISIFISLLAGIIGEYFAMPQLGFMLPIMAVSCIANSLGSVHGAIIARKLQFDKKAIFAINANLIAAMIGVGVAFLVNPLMGLVIMFVLTPVLLSLFMWIFVPWRVQFRFAPKLIVEDLPFALNISFTNLIDQALKSSVPLLIGQRYDANILGYYSRAEAVKNIAGQSIEKVVHKVAFPLLSNARHRGQDSLWTQHIIISQALMFILLPLVWFVHKFSDSIIELLFGPNWTTSGPFLSIVIFSAIFMPLSSLNLTLLKSCGKTFFALLLKAFSLLLILASFSLGPASNFETILFTFVGVQGFQFFASVFGLTLLPDFIMRNYLIKTLGGVCILIAGIFVYEFSAGFSFEMPFINLLSHGTALFFTSGIFFLLFVKFANNGN